MLTDARHPNVPGRGGRRPAAGPVARPRALIVEVPLTVTGPQPMGRARLTIAWTLFAALGLLSLVGCAALDARSNRPIAALLVMAAYALTVVALIWAALETRRSNRRGFPRPSRGDISRA